MEKLFIEAVTDPLIQFFAVVGFVGMLLIIGFELLFAVHNDDANGASV